MTDNLLRMSLKMHTQSTEFPDDLPKEEERAKPWKEADFKWLEENGFKKQKSAFPNDLTWTKMLPDGMKCSLIYDMEIDYWSGCVIASSLINWLDVDAFTKMSPSAQTAYEMAVAEWSKFLEATWAQGVKVLKV